LSSARERDARGGYASEGGHLQKKILDTKKELKNKRHQLFVSEKNVNRYIIAPLLSHLEVKESPPRAVSTRTVIKRAEGREKKGREKVRPQSGQEVT